MSYDPSDPGYTPDPERCPAGGAHTWGTAEEWGTGRIFAACEECGASPPPEVDN